MFKSIANLFKKPEIILYHGLLTTTVDKALDNIKSKITDTDKDPLSLFKEQYMRMLRDLIYSDFLKYEYLETASNAFYEIFVSPLPEEKHAFDALISLGQYKLKFIETMKGGIHHDDSYPFFYDKYIDSGERILWQYRDLDILASYKNIQIGVDVLNSCGCVSKISDNMLERDESGKNALSNTLDILKWGKIKHNDITLTDKSFYIKSKDAFDKLPYTFIKKPIAHKDGFIFTTDTLNGRSLIIKTYDPVFLLNTIDFLSDRKSLCL